ncbi:MAG: tRNA epoxyqueuosine(34) reductase QueG [Pseudomonadota bacterium]
MYDAVQLTDNLRAQAIDLGFSLAAIGSPDAPTSAKASLHAWLSAGRHGDMAWMADRATWRADPRVLWPEVRSVIMLAESYAPTGNPLASLDTPDRASLSCYAWGKDYHDVVKKRLKRLGRWLIDHAGGEIKVFVDTAPVMEKPLAQAAGLGWQGKHTNLVARDLGSWFFIGAVFTTLDLACDEPHEDSCGTCRRCLDICPTAAFPAPYQLDARRCISYLTIELKGSIPREMRPLISNRIYGCDDCLAVCPWNKFAAAAHPAYAPRDGLPAPKLSELAAFDDADFRRFFAGSPVKRIGRDRFLRNVAVAIGNSGKEHLIRTAIGLAKDPSALVRAHAVWALSRLMGYSAFCAEMCPDDDPAVTEEWHLGAAELRARPPSSEGSCAPPGRAVVPAQDLLS